MSRRSSPRGALAQAEATLRALREEARGGYGKDEVRRNCIRADLIAQREAREQAQRRSAARDSAEAGRPSTSCAGVGTRRAADLSFPGSRTGRSFMETPWSAGHVDGGVPTSGTEAEGDAATVVAHARSQQASLCPALLEVATEYTFDVDAAVRMRAVREWNRETGLPQAWAVSGAARRAAPPVALPAAALFTDGGDDLLESMMAHATAATEGAKRSLASAPGNAEGRQRPFTFASPPASRGTVEEESPAVETLLCPRPPAQPRQPLRVQDLHNVYNPSRPPSVSAAGGAVLRVPGHRAVTRQPSLASSSSLPRGAAGQGGSRAGLSAKGTAVAVNYAESFVRDVRRQVARQQHQQQQQLQQPCVAERSAATRSGPYRLSSSVAIIRAYEEEPLDGGAASLLTRVAQPLTLFFCPICQASTVYELGPDAGCTGEASGKEGSPAATAACHRCGAVVALPTAADGLVPARRPSLLDDDAAEGAEQKMEPLAADAGGGTGTDAVAFSTSGSGDREEEEDSFAAAVAAVRRTIAADRAAAAAREEVSAVKTAEDDCAAAAGGGDERDRKPQQRDPTSAADDTPLAGAGSARWERALFGVYFQHLWDEAHRGV